GAMVLITVGFLLPGAPPMADDSIRKITNFFVDNRDEILAGNALVALGAALLLWWLGSLRSYLRAGEGGEGRLSAAAFGGGVLGVALTLALFDIGGDLFAIAGVGFAVLLGAASCSAARSGALPPWAYWFGSVAAV